MIENNCGGKPLIRIYRGTTPTFFIRVPIEGGLSDAAQIVVSFKQMPWGELFEKDLQNGVVLEPEEGQVLAVTLSQAETLALTPNTDLDIMVNWVFDDAQRGAGANLTQKIMILDNFKNEVIEP